MFRTLRRRLVLSHILPLLIVVPLMGLALVYVLETRVILANLITSLKGQADLIAEMAGENSEVWRRPEAAQALLSRVAPRLAPQVMLLDGQGRLLASSDLSYADRIGQPLDLPDLPRALAGETTSRTNDSQTQSAELVEVLTPAIGPEGQTLGVVRLTRQLAGVTDQFLRLRALIAAVLAFGLVLGAAVGLTLAVSLARPVSHVTQAMRALAERRHPTPLVEQGPEEIDLLARAFNTLVARLDELERSQRQLLSNLVHELGQQLGPLVSAVQALRGGADEDPELRHELLAGIDAGLGRTRRLLDDLSRLYDRVAGDRELARRPVALGEWLPTLLIPWREAAQAQGLRYSAQIPATLPTAPIDPDRLAQAIGNILSNAIKYTPPGGSLAIDVAVDDHTLRVRIDDSGPGIAPDEQERIFTPLYRGAAAQRFDGGMGLGLAIAHDLIGAHGGRLELSSKPGHGSHFTISLPLGLDPAALTE